MFNDEFEVLKDCGYKLLNREYNEENIDEILDFIILMETALWRARIKIVRKVANLK